MHKLLTPGDPLAKCEAMERAIVKEITNLVARGTWADLETVKEWTDIAATNPEASVVAAHIILSIKHYELDESCWVFKARLVAGGNRHFSVDGVVIFEEDLFAVPADLDGARIVLSHAVLEQNGEVLQSDVDQAFTQAPLKNDNIFICLPKKLWPDSWKLMRKPVVRLRKALYGLRRSGLITLILVITSSSSMAGARLVIMLRAFIANA